MLRLLLASLFMAFSVAILVAQHGKDDERTKSAAELLGAVTGEPVEAARARGAALGMRVVFQVLAGLAFCVGVLMAGNVILDPATFRGLAVVLAAAAALAGTIALGAATGGLGSPRDWFVVVGGAVVLLAFWAIGRGKRRG